MFKPAVLNVTTINEPFLVFLKEINAVFHAFFGIFQYYGSKAFAQFTYYRLIRKNNRNTCEIHQF